MAAHSPGPALGAGTLTIYAIEGRGRRCHQVSAAYSERMAALIAWLPIVRVDDLVKGGAKRRRLRRSSTLDKIINTNRVLSKRSRPLSRRYCMCLTQTWRLLFILAVTVFCAAAAPAHAQSYPSRPITIVVPYPAGGVTDNLVRLLAERMKTSLGQSIVIENIGGGGGTIGVDRVSRAAPDGYTLVLGNSETMVFAPVTMAIAYNALTDFEPVALLPSYPFLLVTTN